MNNSIGNRQNLRTLQQGYNSIGQFQLALAPSNQQLLLHSYTANNANTGACDIGLGVGLGSSGWKLLRIVAGVATDETAAVQAGTASQLFSLTNNDGYLVEAKKQFGYVSFSISQASTGAPVYTYQYWNGAAWATLTPMQTPVYSSTGFIYLTFNPPADWAVGDGGYTTNNMYSIRVLATTAPATAVLVTVARVSRWLYYQINIGAYARLQATFDTHPVLLDAGEVLSPYFSVAFAQNSVEASYQIAP